MTSLPLTQVFTVNDVLCHLKGRIGRRKLLDHLKATPSFHGGPTHLRWPNRIVFRPADYERLLLSLECPSKSSTVTAPIASTSAAPSADKALAKAQELLTPPAPKNTAPRGSGALEGIGLRQARRCNFCACRRCIPRGCAPFGDDEVSPTAASAALRDNAAHGYRPTSG